VVNLGSGADHRVVDTAGVVNGLAGDGAGAGYVERGAGTGLLSSSGKRLLGYEPQIEFGDGLNNVHGWSADNWANIQMSAEF